MNRKSFILIFIIYSIYLIKYYEFQSYELKLRERYITTHNELLII